MLITTNTMELALSQTICSQWQGSWDGLLSSHRENAILPWSTRESGMARQSDLTAEKLRDLLDYDQDSGIFTWRSTGSGRVRGQPAGSVWKTGYRFIHIEGLDHQASRLAWLHVYGELPAGQIRFADNDPSNLCFSNLRLARTKQEMDERYREVRARANRRNGLKRYGGLTQSEFDALKAMQGGVCAICALPESSTRNGKVRELCVDHDHWTGKVRGILCNICNRGSGLLQDDARRFRRGAEYHAAFEASLVADDPLLTTTDAFERMRRDQNDKCILCDQPNDLDCLHLDRGGEIVGLKCNRCAGLLNATKRSDRHIARSTNVIPLKGTA